MTETTFGNLPIGAFFREKPDENGLAFRWPITKIEPTRLLTTRTVANAKAGSVFFHFDDGDIVIKDPTIKVAVCRHCEQTATFTLAGVEGSVNVWTCGFCGGARKGSEFLTLGQEREAIAYWQERSEQ